MERFAGRTIIVHNGVSVGWVSELHQEAGGGGHFRIDARRLPSNKPTPIEWVVATAVLPHNLPLPLLIKVEPDALLVRHLTRHGTVVHPSEINWMLGEMPGRVHLVLRPGGQGFVPKRVLPVSENDIDFDVSVGV